jgi:hypothetical protein
LERQPVGGFGNGASSITRSKPGEAIQAAIVFRLAPSAIQHCLLGGLGGADPTGPK